MRKFKLAALSASALIAISGCETVDGIRGKGKTGEASGHSENPHNTHEQETYWPENGLSNQQRLNLARKLLNNGRSYEASIELQELQSDVYATPTMLAVTSDLLSQINEDPYIYFASYGGEIHSYVVRRNESLSVIAENKLGSTDKFYALAKLNGIYTPSELSRGQTIIVPGAARSTRRSSRVTTPEPNPVGGSSEISAAPDTPSVTLSEASSLLEKARLTSANGSNSAASQLTALKLALQAERLEPNNPEASEQISSLRALNILQEYEQSRHEEATRAFIQQNFDRAITIWDDVLIINPGNSKARENREKARRNR